MDFMPQEKDVNWNLCDMNVAVIVVTYCHFIGQATVTFSIGDEHGRMEMFGL
jgi:hypothetical protein